MGDAKGTKLTWRCIAWLALWVVGAVALLAVIGIVVPKRYDYRDDVCTYCGIERTTDVQTYAGIPFHRRVKYEETTVSRALRPWLPAGGCPHDWVTLHFGVGRGALLLGWKMHGDGGTRFFDLNILILDDGFARGLASLPRPRDTWHHMVRAGERAPTEVSLIIGSRENYASTTEWWSANRARLEALSRAHRRTD